MKIQILTFNFIWYTISGFWRPVHWSSKRSKLLYNVLTFIILYLFVYLCLTHLMYIIFVVETLDQLLSSIYLIFSMINLWAKIFTITTRRDQIINLIEIIQGKPCKPCDEEEIKIQMTFDRTIRSYSIPYIILCTMSIMATITAGILHMLNGEIPFGSVWVPWDYSSNLIFFFTSLQEIVAMVFGVFVNIATETTILGFCLQICARFEILKHRLQKMIKQTGKDGILTSSSNNTSNNTSNKTSRFSEYVSHHLYIIRLAEMINDVFGQVIFAQFGTSILILCTLLYYMSSHLTLIDIFTFAAYLICMFLQIFYYCWSGNEVTLKSIEFGDEIYNMDWVCMTVSEQKDLLMIMKRSSKPIKFSSSFLITLSLESYSSLLKTSFSAFNLMQQL